MRATQLARALALLALVPAALHAAELRNPGFDDPADPEPPMCDRAAGWERWGQWANRHTNEVGWEPRTGAGFVAYDHWRSYTPRAGWSQVVSNLTGGALYRFGVWAKWEPACNASNIELRIEPLVRGARPAVARYTSANLSDVWSPIGVSCRLPPEATAARCVIQCSHGFGGILTNAVGALKFDDATLEEVQVQPSRRKAK